MYGQSRAMGKREGVNIFYCHGWGSHFDPGKAKIRALSRMGLSLIHISEPTRPY